MKLSQWHDGKVKPVHKGVYEKEENEYQYWNGRFWNCLCGSKREAAKQHLMNPNYKSCWQEDKWRGIVK